MNMRFIFWGTLINFNSDIVLSVERYTKSYTIAYAQGSRLFKVGVMITFEGWCRILCLL